MNGTILRRLWQHRPEAVQLHSFLLACLLWRQRIVWAKRAGQWQELFLWNATFMKLRREVMLQPHSLWQRDTCLAPSSSTLPTAAMLMEAADSEVAQAFSHFTFQASRGKQMVLHLQGVHLEIDPQVVSEDRSFGPGDLGFAGMRAFFRSHRCGITCQQLAWTEKHCQCPRSSTTQNVRSGDIA